MSENGKIMSLIKSKQRVADHGEVFTPPWMVDAMLDLVKGETDRISASATKPISVLSLPLRKLPA